MASNTNPTLTTFDVSNVEPASFEYEEIGGDLTALRRLAKSGEPTRRKGQATADTPQAPLKKIESFSRIPRPLIDIANGDARYKPISNPFVETVNEAFDQHFPLRLSPDHLWLTIAQAVSLHLKQNPHDGPAHLKAGEKEPIVVDRDEFILGSLDNDWEGALEEFGGEIRKRAGEEFHDQFVQKFSTTTSVESTAMQVTLMEAGSLYFEYITRTRCGIPNIELEGTVEDWEKLMKLSDSVAQYGMGWWVPHLRIILGQFLNSAKGEVDRPFWKSFYKLDDMSGGPYVNGHFLKLFPYLTMDGQLQVNQYLDENASGHGCQTDAFPGGYATAPMVWDYYRVYYGMQLISGFSGTSQGDSLALRPEIGWVLVHAPEVVCESTTLDKYEETIRDELPR